MNNTQTEAVKYLIIHSKDATELAKKILFFLLEQPEALKISTCITVIEGSDGFSKKDVLNIYNSIHDMKSSNGTTHLNEIMKVAGSNFLFFAHAGAFHPDGEFKEYDNLLSYTVWLSDNRYDFKAKRKSLTKETLIEIELSSHLYENAN